MRRVLRRFKDNGSKQDDIVDPSIVDSSQDSLEMSEPAKTADAGLSVPPSQAKMASVEDNRPSFQDNQMIPLSSRTTDPAKDTQGLSIVPDSRRANSIYSKDSSFADESLFSRRTESTAQSFIGSSISGRMSKHSAEERIRVMKSSSLSESHGKTPVPISTSPVETRARDITGMTTMGIAPMTAPFSIPEPLKGPYIRQTAGPSLVPKSTQGQAPEETETKVSFETSMKALATNIETLFSSIDSTSAPRISGIMAQLMNDFTSIPALENRSQSASIENDDDLNLVIRCTLGVSDNLLRAPMVRNAKCNLLRALYRLGVALGLLEVHVGAVPQPRNWALGIRRTSQDEIVGKLMNKLYSSPVGSIVEQEGAYVAPVLRGFSPTFSVATVCFGIPRPDESIFDSITSLASIIPSIHVYGRMDYLRTCAEGDFGGIVPPYRQIDDDKKLPMSISVASEGAGTISGTLGGFLYPLIEDEDDDLKGYTFAITCGHVCLNTTSSNANASTSEYNNALVPSPVLFQMFRKALLDERNKHEEESLEYQGYQRAISDLEKRPPLKLGPVVWGERTVVNGMLSDIAIIKCDNEFQCRNSLGSGLSLSQYDPGLMFSNLVVSEVVTKAAPGLPVFKYGSTSRYTNGNTSISRIVYWSSGKVQSSEFVVNSDQPVFATGGDSGAWILTKGKYGLGVVGMLHSYDGEMKEFGLYTPVTVILNRLQQVTGVQWGVVGVPHPKDQVNESVL